jgi:NDP-sugar pyrophosphorylase family protein
MTAAILAGGMGNRLRDMTGDTTQKVLYLIAGKPLIYYSIDLFDPEDIGQIIFCLGHLANKVRSWSEEQEIPFQVDLMQQEEAGVVAATRQAFALCDQPEMIVCNGDEIRIGLSLKAAIEFHRSHDRLGTMVATYASNLSRHRLLCIDQNSGLIDSYLHPRNYLPEPDKVGLVNTGLLILRKGAVDLFDGESWGGIIDPLCRAGMLAVNVQSDVLYFNVGTPDEYREASRALASLNTPP